MSMFANAKSAIDIPLSDCCLYLSVRLSVGYLNCNQTDGNMIDPWFLLQ